MKRTGWVVSSLFLLCFNLHVSAIEDEWISISSVEAFIQISSNNRYRLSEDLDFSGIELDVFEELNDVVIDGNHKVLKNITIQSDQPYVGLFSVLQSSSIYDLRIESAFVESNHLPDEGSFIHGTGILAGLSIESVFSNIYVSRSSITSISEVVGGLIGRAQELEINHSIIQANISGTTIVGGVVGFIGPIDVFAEDPGTAHSSLHQVAFMGNLILDRQGGGLIGLVYTHPLTISEAYVDVVMDVQGDVGLMIAEIYEANTDISDVSVNGHIQNESYDETMGYPSLIHTYIEDYPRSVVLRLQRILIRATWRDQTPVGVYDPYLHTLFEGDTCIEGNPLESSDLYYLDTLLDVDHLGSSSSDQLKDVTYLSSFNFVDIWNIEAHLNEGYPYPRFIQSTITYHTYTDSNIEDTYIKTQDIQLMSDPIREGYDFDGWYLDENYMQVFDPSLVYYDDIDIYAKWNQQDVLEELPPVASISITVYAPEEPVQITPEPPKPVVIKTIIEKEETIEEDVELELINTQVIDPIVESTQTIPTEESEFSLWWLWLLLLIIAVIINWIINRIDRRPKPRT